MMQCKLTLAARILPVMLALSTISAAQDSWKATEEAAARAGESAHFDEAEELLSENLKFAETLGPKDPRRPRTLFDLAEVYRAEGKYSEALPLYERALQIYTRVFGDDAAEVADTLDG
jgi:tetratricopeptide (TPR) repeat protein